MMTVFDKTKLDEYAKRAKEQWGTTPEYKEFEVKKLQILRIRL